MKKPLNIQRLESARKDARAAAIARRYLIRAARRETEADAPDLTPVINRLFQREINRTHAAYGAHL